MVFDEKKLTRWIAAYFDTADEFKRYRPNVIKPILDEELAGPNRKAWLERVSSILKLFVPEFCLMMHHITLWWLNYRLPSAGRSICQDLSSYFDL